MNGKTAGIDQDRADDSSSRMAAFRLTMPPKKIALFKAVVESYENLATLRTEDPSNHCLKLYFAPELANEVNALIDSIAAELEIRRLG